jgi:aminopeptidase-like protein
MKKKSSMKKKIYQIEMKYACAGVIVDQGTVIAAAPIFAWAVGKKWDVFEAWVKKKNGIIRDPNQNELSHF